MCVCVWFHADSASHKSRTAGKKLSSASGATADVSGAMGVFCTLSQDTTVSASSSVRHGNRTTDSPALPVHQSANNPPALPPRMPTNKGLSSQSCRQPRARSSDRGSADSVISPVATKENRPASQARGDSLDVFIPLSGDEQDEPDVRDEPDDRNQFTFNGTESQQIARANTASERLQLPVNNEGSGLDALVGSEDESDSEKTPTPCISEPTSFANASADGRDSIGDKQDISEGRRQYNEHALKRIRPTVGRRLTRKETTKLSRKLTRKMSCRQQHALMMASEFDEFDELDVVVEMGNVAEDEDEDDLDGGGKLAAEDGGLEETNGEGLQTDASFDQRVTTKLQYDQLQVIFM